MAGSSMLYGLVALLLVALTSAQSAPAPTAAKEKKHESSPFTAFTKSLDQPKRKPFMELMKRLRTAKAATVGTKEEKKKATTSLDADIHKLLGTEYKRYRSVQHAQKELHAAKKSGSSSSSKVISPPPPGGAAAATPTATKPKKAKLPGAGSKKKGSSTTIG